MKNLNFYERSGLDRMAERRRDSAWLEQLLRSGDAVILPVWRSMNLIAVGEQPQPVHIRAEEAHSFVQKGASTVFLGISQETPYFTIDLSHLDEPEVSATGGDGAEFMELRRVGADLGHSEGGMLAYARGILHWHARHLYCGVCGHPTESRDAGHMRACTNAACGTSHFPRTDPAVIMLVRSGNRALLGRKREWPDGMNSTLAGFVEPGESLEDAVAREVWEESGVVVENARYQSSQPWPFPSSLMLGFYADAVTEEISRNDAELEDCQWFTAEELLNETSFAKRPRSDSIARRLIDNWIAESN